MSVVILKFPVPLEPVADVVVPGRLRRWLHVEDNLNQAGTPPAQRGLIVFAELDDYGATEERHTLHLQLTGMPVQAAVGAHLASVHSCGSLWHVFANRTYQPKH